MHLLLTSDHKAVFDSTRKKDGKHLQKAHQFGTLDVKASPIQGITF